MSLSLLSIYIYISSFDLILAHPTCISSVLLSLTSFRFSYVANYVLPVFEHNLAYSTHLYISPSLLNSNRLSIVFFCFFILSFSYFSRSIIFVFSFFFSLCICLSCLSIYLPAYCLSFLTRRLPLIVRVKQIMIQRLQFYNIFVRQYLCGKYQCLIIIYQLKFTLIYQLNFNSNCIYLICILEIILEPYSIGNRINLSYL